ncbi:NfeD family protein [Chitinimonas arctica]|uniref:NfeD family protein n=1 Tax=Chitinimonas arctica TaxID=2594795 RepID=A0A516SGB8_9NEIS|nr:NfeD family protein [Chitinimonas arctica]QDQ27068.1 NfeD family protein [Chitinimonas arctica]
MENYLIWFVLALLLAGAEMLSGTFYLLVYSLCCALGGVAAVAGLPVPAQLSVAAACAVVGTLWLRRHPISRPSRVSGNLDLGHRVEVESWKSELTARVRYRGTGWDAELAAPLAERPGTLYIVGQRGNTLIVSPVPPATGA